MTTLIPKFDLKNGGTTPVGAVNRSIDSKLGDCVNVKDFGAVGDGVTDDTVAVQNAVDYCIANNKDLLVDGLCKLTASVNIDRQVDNTLYSAYFTIASNSGGGFLITTAIPMFSTTLTFTTAPVSQLVRFENLLLKSTYGSAGSYVLDNAKFLRTGFVGCSFVGVQCLSAPTVYTQSLYFESCQARYIVGKFFYSAATTYDLKVHNCLIEATEQAFYFAGGVGCAFTQNTIEGCTTQAAIEVRAVNGLEVSGNYFEANAIDLNFNVGDALGVSVTGNYFGPIASGFLEHVIWDVAYNCISQGNYCPGSLHQLTTNSEVNINDFATVAVSNIEPTQNLYGALVQRGTIGYVANIADFDALKYIKRINGATSVTKNLCTIDFGAYAGVAIVDMVATGQQPAVDSVSQMNRWVITKDGGGITITAASAYNEGLTPVAATVSGNTVIISWTYGGSASNNYSVNLEVMATAANAGGAYVPVSVTIL